MTFNIGDKVRVVRCSDNPKLIAHEGIVCSVESAPSLSIGVEFPFYDSSLHDCDKHCRKGYGWFIEEEDLILVDSKFNYHSTDTNKHYSTSEVQPIEFIQQILKDAPTTPFQSACVKDIIKYSSRFGRKDGKVKEAKKIVDYALWLLIDTMGKKIDPRTMNHTEILKGLKIE